MYIFNSRAARAGAILFQELGPPLGFFYNSKNLNCIGALSFYYDSKRSIGEVLFLINFIGVNFEAGNETRENIWSDFVAEQNEEWSEQRVVFCSYRCFLESEKLRCDKNSVSEQNFLFT